MKSYFHVRLCMHWNGFSLGSNNTPFAVCCVYVASSAHELSSAPTHNLFFRIQRNTTKYIHIRKMSKHTQVLLTTEITLKNMTQGCVFP